MTDQNAVVDVNTLANPKDKVRQDIMNRITPNPVNTLGISVGKTVKAKKPRVEKVETKVEIASEMSNKEAIPSIKQNSVLRLGNIIKGVVIKSVSGIKNVFVGTGIVFMNKLPKYLAPIAFIVRNSPTIGLGALNVAAPLVISSYVGKTALASEFINANNALAYNLLCQASLVVTAAVVWIVGIEIIKHFYKNVSKTVADFEEIGKKS